MPVHDLFCTSCNIMRENVWCRIGARGVLLPRCQRCGGKQRWMPFVPNTDVYGSTKTSEVLYEDIGRPATYTSRRELEAKMKRIGFTPCGDPVGGARNNDGYRGTSFSQAGMTSRATPRARRPGADT